MGRKHKFCAQVSSYHRTLRNHLCTGRHNTWKAIVNSIGNAFGVWDAKQKQWLFIQEGMVTTSQLGVEQNSHLTTGRPCLPRLCFWWRNSVYKRIQSKQSPAEPKVPIEHHWKNSNTDKKQILMGQRHCTTWVYQNRTDAPQLRAVHTQEYQNLPPPHLQTLRYDDGKT